MKPRILSDEVLMSYADGRLQDPEATQVREAAASDPAIAARIEMFRDSQRLLREAFAPVLQQPVPQRLNDAVQRLGDPQGRRDIPPVGSRRLPRRRRWRLSAIAAAAALLFTLAANWGIVSGLRNRHSGNLLAALSALPEPLTDTLDRLPSGEIARITIAAREVELLPLASYADGGAVCREFELNTAAATPSESLRGLVCRGNDRWLLRAASETKASSTSGDDYLPASGGAELASGFGLKHPLSEQEERRLIARNWR